MRPENLVPPLPLSDELEERPTANPQMDAVDIMEAMLRISGETGFRNVSDEFFYQLFGWRYFRNFRGKTHCFVASYDWKANELVDHAVALLNQVGSVEDRLLAVLASLDGWLAQHQAVGRAIFIEIHAAGSQALLKRQEILRRLSEAIDRTCREDDRPPSLTAEFWVNAVDQVIAGALLKERPGDFSDAVPELAYLITRAYSV